MDVTEMERSSCAHTLAVAHGSYKTLHLEAALI